MFKHNYNAQAFSKIYSINLEPSETVPGMAMTIAEIMRKFANGIPVNVSRSVSYDNQESFDAFDPTQDPSFDLADYSERMSEVHARTRANKEAIEAKRKAATQEPKTGKDEPSNSGEPATA